ncbi:hypothetical protein SynNOUM97013_01070 [Synechococcus sp. NOUM97013]|nr:hypothetical protein SynNOUM97013_01070 [Synechococcus sp. NOUM97013]
MSIVDAWVADAFAQQLKKLSELLPRLGRIYGSCLGEDGLQ